MTLYPLRACIIIIDALPLHALSLSFGIMADLLDGSETLRGWNEVEYIHSNLRWGRYMVARHPACHANRNASSEIKGQIPSGSCGVQAMPFIPADALHCTSGNQHWIIARHTSYKAQAAEGPHTDALPCLDMVMLTQPIHNTRRQPTDPACCCFTSTASCTNVATAPHIYFKVKLWQCGASSNFNSSEIRRRRVHRPEAASTCCRVVFSPAPHWCIRWSVVAGRSARHWFPLRELVQLRCELSIIFDFQSM